MLVVPGRVAFRRPGMAVTLNGIAQGYITDRVADLLAQNGLEHVLVDLDELRALGPRADGTPWPVGIEDPMRPGRTVKTVELADRAMGMFRRLRHPVRRRGALQPYLRPRHGPLRGSLSKRVADRAARRHGRRAFDRLLRDAVEIDAVVKTLGTVTTIIMTKNGSLTTIAA